MKKYLLLFVLLSNLLLAACQPSAASPTSAPTTATNGATPQGSKSYPAPGSESKAYPAPKGTQANGAPAKNVAAPTESTTDKSLGGYPAPQGTNGSAFPVTADDAAMVKGNFMMDSATLQPVANQPGQADVMAQGSLPTNCNKPRVVVPAPDADKKILIQAYSLVEKGKICTQAIEPFNGKLATLSGLPSGKYTVMVNEVNAGELTVP